MTLDLAVPRTRRTSCDPVTDVRFDPSRKGQDRNTARSSFQIRRSDVLDRAERETIVAGHVMQFPQYRNGEFVSSRYVPRSAMQLTSLVNEAFHPSKANGLFVRTQKFALNKMACHKIAAEQVELGGLQSCLTV